MITAKLLINDAKNSYGAKDGEAQFVGWQMHAPNLAGFTQTPGPFAGGAFDGQVFQSELPAVPARTFARGGGRGASGHHSPNPAHAPNPAVFILIHFCLF